MHGARKQPAVVAALGALLIAGRAVAAEPPPAPPYPSDPPARHHAPPPGYYYPAPPPDEPPPPLPPAVRVLYAPFYAAGLVVRYGFYYAIVAPLEVFGRALSFGPDGGVERPSRRPPREEP